MDLESDDAVVESGEDPRHGLGVEDGVGQQFGEHEEHLVEVGALPLSELVGQAMAGGGQRGEWFDADGEFE